MVEPLTQREQNILAHLANGRSNQEIAGLETLAYSSVKWYIHQIYAKLGVNQRCDAITRGRELGLLPPEAVTPANLQVGKNNLPRQLTSFIGREEEIALLLGYVQVLPLVTITGSGGTGKTRLALQVADRAVDAFPDGAWFVDLAPLADPGLVPLVTATALGMHAIPSPSPLQALSEFIGQKSLLVILDNCEHLVEAAAILANALLAACPRLHILATSREALGVKGERPFRCPPLCLPDAQSHPTFTELAQSESLRLFVERAQVVSSGFRLTEANVRLVSHVCRQLDGIPLAIELAAARVRLLSIEQIAARLDNVFHLLTGGGRTALPRHQTLKALVDWSYDLLSEKERRLLRRLSVFAGSWTLEAAEAVCACLADEEPLPTDEILDLLGQLVDKSLVSVQAEQCPEPRYRMLEMIRQYAHHRLLEGGGEAALRQQHLDYYLRLAEAIEPQLRTALAVEQLHTLYQEVENLRMALSWAFDDTGNPKIEAGLRLASALLNFWHTQSFHIEGYTWLRKGIAASPDLLENTSVNAKACFSTGHLVLPLGRQEEASQWLQKSLDIYQRIEDTAGVVMAQSILGENLAWRSQFDKARELCEASVARCRILNDPWLLAWVLCRYGLCISQQGDGIPLARQILRESLSIFEKIGDKLQVGDIFSTLGWIAYNQEDFAESRDYFGQALIAGQVMQSNWSIGLALANLGMVAYMQDELNKMHAYLLESVPLCRMTGSEFLTRSLSLLGIAEMNLGHPRQAILHYKECLQISNDSYIIAASLLGIARAELQQKHSWFAARLLGVVKRLLELEVHRFNPVERKEYERGMVEAKFQLDAIALEQAILEGGAMNLEQAVALAMEVQVE